MLPARLNCVPYPTDAERAGLGALQKATIASDDIVHAILRRPGEL